MSAFLFLGSGHRKQSVYQLITRICHQAKIFFSSIISRQNEKITFRFNDFIKRLAKDERLHRLTKKSPNADNNGTYEELVLRFFAYLYNRDLFVHNVKDYLNEFMKWASVNYNEREYEDIFNRVFDELSALEHGIVKNVGRKTTSIVFWEAITVGAAVALRNGAAHLNLEGFYEWVADEQFNRLVTGATNSRQMIDNRIEYTSNKFSQAHV